MRTIDTVASHPASIGDEFKPKTEEITQAANKNIGFEAEIETAERYFKALREIEFITLWIC
jgi:hypothetical protein